MLGVPLSAASAVRPETAATIKSELIVFIESILLSATNGRRCGSTSRSLLRTSMNSAEYTSVRARRNTLTGDARSGGQDEGLPSRDDERVLVVCRQTAILGADRPAILGG